MKATKTGKCEPVKNPRGNRTQTGYFWPLWCLPRQVPVLESPRSHQTWKSSARQKPLWKPYLNGLLLATLVSSEASACFGIPEEPPNLEKFSPSKTSVETVPKRATFGHFGPFRGKCPFWTQKCRVNTWVAIAGAPKVP